MGLVRLIFSKSLAHARSGEMQFLKQFFFLENALEWRLVGSQDTRLK